MMFLCRVSVGRGLKPSTICSFTVLWLSQVSRGLRRCCFVVRRCLRFLFVVICCLGLVRTSHASCRALSVLKYFIWLAQNDHRFRDIRPSAVEVRLRFNLPVLYRRFKSSRRRRYEELDSCSQTLVMWNGTKVTPVGSCALPVLNPKTNEKYKVRFLVVKEDLTPLLGSNATQKTRLLTVHKENFINVVENANDDLTANYADVFTKVSEDVQEMFACKLTQIASLLSFQQENLTLLDKCYPLAQITTSFATQQLPR